MKKKGAKPVRLKHPMDVALGARIREVRLAQTPRVSQQWIAMECGFTIQQMHKYETGENSLRFSRLCEIADALDVSLLELIGPVVGSAHPAAEASGPAR